MASTLSVLLRLKANTSQATEALEGFRSHVQGVTSAIEGDFSALGKKISGIMSALGPEGAAAAGAIAAIAAILADSADKPAQIGSRRHA